MVEVVQGRVEATAPRRVKWGYGYFPQVVVHTASGDRTFKKVSAAAGVRDVLERGGEGIFYLSRHAGMLGIHGVKLSDGTKHYAHFNNFEKLGLAAAGIAGLLLVLFLMGKEVPLLAVIIGVGFAIWYPIARKDRLANERAFQAA